MFLSAGPFQIAIFALWIAFLKRLLSTSECRNEAILKLFELSVAYLCTFGAEMIHWQFLVWLKEV